MIGIIYFIVVILANTLGAVSGMGGGVLIKPIFDFIGVDSVLAISFYSSVAVFTMSLVSTMHQLKQNILLDGKKITGLSMGALIGGIFGNQTLFSLIRQLPNEKDVQLIQIGLTILSLFFALVYSNEQHQRFSFTYLGMYIICGIVLGFLASLLGIGGGPINVSLLMLLFSMSIKQATVYSIATIFFSQSAKLLTMGLTTGFGSYDLTRLWFIVPAAIIGGILGAKLSKILPSERVSQIFKLMILLVILINLYNGM
ncbi:sulfite exporter TauE/SafE family protein [Vagococcus zengguangii]|uniref:sulfite exporter TauE/SafE family protein n=1 Tax=Vagococcus zengguangii TaxID=2571750 RepID=UPI001107F818|nr:sulfite exporter TauE/SafE family protein [Vagococcus zengguangii]TLG79614.1 sulfite exporter TauE/SafE family protein [Vagococcus zengguangii]